MKFRYAAIFLVLQFSAQDNAPAEEAIVELVPEYWEGCEVVGDWIRLADRIIAQRDDEPIVIEAEDAARIVFQKEKQQKVSKQTADGPVTEFAPWSVQEDEKASGGKYFDWVSYAEFRFFVNTPGRYVRWERYAVPGPSYYHKESVDGETPFWDLEDPSGRPKLEWLWKFAEVRIYAPRRRVYFDLARGDHAIKLHTFYNGARLDKIVLARDPNYKPEGLGPPATALTVPQEGHVDLMELAPPGVRSWGSLEADYQANGGSVEFQVSSDGGESYQALSEKRPLRKLRPRKGQEDRLRLRVRLIRGRDGVSPVLGKIKVSFTPEPGRLLTLRNRHLELTLDRESGKLLGMVHAGAGPVSRQWMPSSLFQVSLKRPGDPEIVELAQDAFRMTGVTSLDLEDGRCAEFDYEAPEHSVRVSLRFAIGASVESRWSARIMNDARETDVVRFRFPILEGLRIGPDGHDDQLATPWHTGKVIANPSSASQVSLKYQGSASPTNPRAFTWRPTTRT